MSSETTNSGWSPTMHADEHIGTYDAFITGAKYGTAAVVVLLILMAIFLL